MGFGKTHFETLLWHLYTEIPNQWKVLRSKVELEDSLDKLTEKAFYKPSIAEKTIVLALDLKSVPESMDPYTAIFENSARILEEYKKATANEELISLMRTFQETEPKRAATELASFIRKSGHVTPVLILLDELYACVFEIAQGGDLKQIESLTNLMIFLTSFIDELKEHSPVALVYASAQQDINRWAELVKMKEHLIKMRPAVANLISVINHFEDRTSRVQIPMKQITSEDIINVVLKRLLKPKAPRKEMAKPIATACMDIVQEYTSKEATVRYYDELTKTYPFTPTYRFFAEKLLAPTIGGDLPKTQHVRDLLKVTASLIARVYESRDWDKVSLISLAYLTHDDVNHLVEERYSMEWRRLYFACINSISEIKDGDSRFLAEKMLSIVYLKSLTTNISKLIDMIRTPEILPREEILMRGASTEDLIFSLAGAISEKVLPKFHEAYDYLAKSTPYVIDVEHAAKKYLVLSFVFNPLELIESFKKEETAQFRTAEGLVIDQKMIEYFRKQLESEYKITGMFTQISEKTDKPKLVLLNYGLVTTAEKTKPRIIDYLDKDRFTITVLTPWSIFERILENKKPVDYIKEVKQAIQKLKNDLPYPNMFAVVVPRAEKDLIERLCNRIAEVHAAKKVVSYLRIEKVEEGKRKKLELVRRTPTYQTLLDLLKEEERKFEDIILDIMDSLQTRIEEYAKNYTNTAVQDYVGEFVGSFRSIIYFDAKKDTIIDDTLEVKYEFRDAFEKVYAELPVWIANAAASKCGIDSRNSMISKLIKYVAEPSVAKHKETLVKGEKVTVQADPLVEAAMRGWKDLPIRPLSRGEMESAIGGIAGVYFIENMNVKVYSQLTKEGARTIVIELVEKPPPPPPPPTQVVAIEIWGVNNVVMGIELLEKHKLGKDVETVDISIETVDECSLHIVKASLDDLEWAIGDDPISTFVNRLSPKSPEVKFAKLYIKLSIAIRKEKVEKLLADLGISEDSFNLLTG
jgi:hypothetical protein